jgi:hypothetical protein
MGFPLDVYKSHRLVLLRSKRKTQGEPSADSPDVDDRGHLAPFRGPLVGVTAGKKAKVLLIRKRLDPKAKLIATSSDGSILKISSPDKGELPSAEEMEVEIEGVDGGNNKKEAKLQVRYEKKDGIILHELNIWVLKELEVDITPHRITIRSSSTAGTAPTVDIDAVMERVGQIWGHCGIKFNVHPVIDKTLTFAHANRASDDPLPGEIGTLLGTDWVSNTINAYFIVQIGTGSTLGYGFSRSSFSTFSMPNPGIILADQTAGSTRGYVMFWANDLAHEIGHFFTLWHPEQKQPPEEREDTWSKRSLMHNFNEMWGPNPWPRNDGDGNAYKFRSRFDDAGYGTKRRGCFISLKDLPQLSGDNECLTARTTITSAAGPY